MVEVLLVSDSHVPSREPEIPAWVLERIESAPYTVHAGDYDSPEALATVREAANDLTAVYGNMDPDIDLPGTATLDVEGVRFVVTHGTASGPDEYERVVLEAIESEAGEGPTVGVCGHTHQVMDETFGEYRVLNPGSCTGASPASTTSVMTAEVADGSVSVTVHKEP
jgi:hypothetical protein